MRSRLQEFVQTSTLCDTHEHMEYEAIYRTLRPDVLRNLFDNYVVHDLVSAGADPGAVHRLLEGPREDIRARFEAVRPAWEAVRHTGYGEAVGLTAKRLFDLDEITPDGLEAAEARSIVRGEPGERLHLLRDVAKLDHIQIDPDGGPVPPEAAGQDFFLYDLNVHELCAGTFDPRALADRTGRTVHTLADLDAALDILFEQSAPHVIALKSQHAYSRTLAWQERTRTEAEAALSAHLSGKPADDLRLCLGDWCIGRIADLAVAYDLPFKIHTGYYAHNGTMPVDYINSGNLSRLLIRYPRTKFVLMHIAYPYSDELAAIAKHFPGVAVDMCWAWSLNPLHSADFLRRFLHSVPLNKLFPFGGDSWLPAASVGYSIQARNGLLRALEAEIADGFVDEMQAIGIARRLMLQNACDFFAVGRKKDALRAADAGAPLFEEPRGTVRTGGKSPPAGGE